MVSQIIKNTFENVYKDDFSDSDNYHRILFNAGRPVQARELTQLQTIIQKEMERFGRNIFKEGAAVNPVNSVFVDNRYAFVKLQGVTTLSTDLIGESFTGATSGVVGEILEVVDAVGSDPATIYVAYKSGGTSGTRKTFSAGESISNGTTTLTVQSTDTTANPAVGYGTKVSVGSGEFFILGHFIFSDSKDTILSKYTTNPTAQVGFIVNESIVTAADDNALYDNQGDLPNTTAPGADRYRIRLSLVNKNDVDSDQTFVFVANIINGEVVETNNGRNEYNLILDVLAQRTYEESGNYTVKPFLSTFSNNLDSDAVLNLRISNGIAYVKGYRIEGIPSTIEVPKPTTTTTIQNDAVIVNYGNYVNVDTLKGIPNLSQYEKLNLINDSDYASGSTIGTARIRAIEPIGNEYRFHLFDVQMNSGQNFRDTRSIGTSSVKNAKIVLDNGVAVLNDPRTNDALFSLPRWRPSLVTDTSLTVQRIFTGTTDGSGNLTLTLSTGGEAFSSTSDWIVAVDSSGDIITPTITPTTTTQTNITGAPSNSALTLFGFVLKGGSSATSKTKTLTTTTVTNAIDSDGNGLLFVPLDHPDIYELDSARLGSSSGIDIKSKFRLDNGQRDNFYANGRLILNTGESAPSGNVYAKFKYFAHSGTGNFFSVNSYDGQVDYKNIPTYRQKDGTYVNLSDVLDFRPTINSAGTGFTGTGSNISEFPQSTELVTADISYYNSRRDKLVIEPEKGLNYILGTESLNPQEPDTPSDSMIIYRFKLNPNTLNAKDLSYQFIENRRYTMRDIGKIEQRISRVEELATLSLLDIQASTLEVLDSAGLNRTKSGFLTDDFRDHRSADVGNEEYRAAIKPDTGILSTSFRQKNVGLIFDSAQSTNTVLTSNLVMLDYTEEEYLEQPEASRTQNINPFLRINYDGRIYLSPSTDEWVDEVTVQNVIETVVTVPAPTQPSWQEENNEVRGFEIGASPGETVNGWTQTGPDTWSQNG